MAAGMGLTGKIYWGDLLSGQHSLHIKECSDFTPPPPGLPTYSACHANWMAWDGNSPSAQWLIGKSLEFFAGCI